MAFMTNNDWGTAGEHPRPTHPQNQTREPSANEVETGTDPSSGSGNQPHPTQAQQQRQDWSTDTAAQAPVADWTHSPQPQQIPPAQDWSMNPQGSQPHQGGNQRLPDGPGHPPQWQQQQAGSPNPLVNIFDFSFRKFALPNAGGALFLVITIAAGLWWLTEVIHATSFGGGPYGVGATFILQAVIGGLARTVIIIVAARAFLEAMACVVRSSRHDQTP